jgi:segregation and condensation protein A
MSAPPTTAGEGNEPSRAPRVVLADFNGPLDLLLHLVRTGGLDISGLPVLEVVRQCDAYLRTIETLDLEAAGDHLVMAATLLHMKSRALLPPDPEAIGPLLEEEDEGPSRLQGIVSELRRAAESLQEREAAMELVYARPAERVAEFASEQGIEADLYALVNAFQGILARLGARAETERRITRERVSLMDRVTWLIDRLQKDRRIPFRALFEDLDERFDCILTFLALLEVLRLRVARAYQSHRDEDLLVILADEPAPLAAEPPHPEEQPIDA